MKAKILIVDDERIVAESIEAMLATMDYIATGAASTEAEALQAIAQNRPDAVLMDVRLGDDEEGIAVAEKIRAQFDLPVVYVTAHTDDATLKRAKLTRPFGYVTKPFESRDLRVAIELALHNHGLEQRLRESEIRYRTLMEQANDAIFLADAETGQLVDANMVAQKLIGRSLAEICRMHQFELHPPEQSAGARVSFKKSVVSGRSIDFGLCVIHRDGTRIPVEISTSVFFLGGKKVILGIFRNITERKQAEEDRLVLSKLESTGLLAGGIAHDFNNLLTTILMNLELAQSGRSNREDMMNCLRASREATLAAAKLTQQLLTFAHGGMVSRQPTDLAGVIRESVPSALSGANVRSEISVAADLWRADVDGAQIEQVIRNLVLNAREAMAGGGVVFIRAKNVVVKAEAGLKLSPGEYVLVSVTDHGHGIPAEVLPKIFDPYFSTKQRGSQKGMGLGLTICHSVIQKHGGVITVEFTPGQETTFHVYLPACGPAAAAESKPAPSVVSPARVPVSGRILVMDDQEFMREIVGKVLEHMGYEVELAADGRAAIDCFAKAQAMGRAFDLVLLDLTVSGGMGGPAALAEIRALHPGVKAVVMSGYANDEVVRHHARFGFQGALTKPFDLATLQAVISKVM